MFLVFSLVGFKGNPSVLHLFSHVFLSLSFFLFFWGAFSKWKTVVPFVQWVFPALR